LFQVLETLATGGGGFSTLATPRREIPTSGMKLNMMSGAHRFQIFNGIRAAVADIGFMVDMNGIMAASGEGTADGLAFKVDQNRVFGDVVKSVACGHFNKSLCG